jgi:CspA family cold shock protein
MTGTVRWFNDVKGAGLIAADSGISVTVHFSALRGEGYRGLESGERVEFSLAEGEKGMQAEDVTVL